MFEIELKFWIKKNILTYDNDPVICGDRNEPDYHSDKGQPVKYHQKKNISLILFF